MSVHDINASFARDEATARAAAIEAGRRRIEHLDQLSELAADPLFKDFRRELVAEVEQLKEALTQVSAANVDFIRGQITGLRRAILFFEIRAEEIRTLESEMRDASEASEKLDNPTRPNAEYTSDDEQTVN